MRKLLVLFACIVALCLALTTCDDNDHIITLLRSPSELAYLNVSAYVDDFQLIGGTSMEPGFKASVREYTVYIAKDANRFTVDAGLAGAGTVVAHSVRDGIAGPDFDYLDDEPMAITLTVQREWMDIGEYRLTVERADMVPPADNVEIRVVPEVAAFFIQSIQPGKEPVLEIKADLPPEGGELTYQWYFNTKNDNMTGFPESGAAGAMAEETGADGETHYYGRYQMRRAETFMVRTIYFYVEITNTLDGKTGVIRSLPQSVTFLNRGELDYKSTAMADVPPGTVTSDDPNNGHFVIPGDTKPEYPWTTPGFQIGKYHVTWELWKMVREHSEAGSYRFANTGNQGAYRFQNTIDHIAGDVYTRPEPVGNELHPATKIGWRDAVVWCNAYSEMDGLEPVYRDAAGEPLRDSTMPVEVLIDMENMEWNGYRLPSVYEYNYARQGGNPNDSSSWNTDYSADKYQTFYRGPEPAGKTGYMATEEVGKDAQANPLGIYNMVGLACHWVWYPDFSGYSQDQQLSWAVGGDFQFSGNWNYINPVFGNVTVDFAPLRVPGFRVARDKE